MKTYYWWKFPRVHSIKRKKNPKALIELEAKQIDGIYSNVSPTSAGNDDTDGTSGKTKASLLGFVKAFLGDLVAANFMAVICGIVIYYFSDDFLALGPHVILYDGLLLTGIGVCLGLQIKWYRDYKSAGGRVFRSEE